MFFGRHGFRRYRVKTGKHSLRRAFTRCDVLNAEQAERGLTNPFQLYRTVVGALQAERRIEVLPLAQLMEPLAAGRIRVALRHDVDGDCRTALRAARHLARVGIPGSFYLLHTSPYYGRVSRRGTFRRHPGAAELVHALLLTGVEIGLHCDPLSLYLDHGIDGAGAVRTELNWLRKQGVRVRGVVAHNSAAAYGAENFEVFRQYRLEGRDAIQANGRRIPLGVVDAAELGIRYEGNYPVPVAPRDSDAVARYLQPPADAVRSADWLRLYLVDNPLFDRAYDVSIWLLGRDTWAIGEHHPQRAFRYPVTTTDVLEFLRAAEAGSRIVVTIHPAYVCDA